MTPSVVITPPHFFFSFPQIYGLDFTGLSLVGTAELPLAAYHMNTMMSEKVNLYCCCVADASSTTVIVDS